jgi:hypothetical protein
MILHTNVWRNVLPVQDGRGGYMGGNERHGEGRVSIEVTESTENADCRILLSVTGRTGKITA